MKYKRLVAIPLSLLLLCALFACSAPMPQAYVHAQQLPVSPRPLTCKAEGELSEAQDEAERYLAPAQDVQEYIYRALLAEQSDIDISDYKITTEQITVLYTRIMNTHPDLFYVNPGISYTYTSANHVVTLKPSYNMTGEELETARVACAQALDEICVGVDEAWSDFEIALYLHDYLCLNFEYDTDYEIYDMYQFLMHGEGVCQAYTLTYMALLARYGIASDAAISEEMNHIWNVVTLGGQTYHVDVTWDDPVPNMPGRALHVNFLRSDTGIAQTEHHSWVCESSCTADAYESTFVLGIERAFAYTAGQWLYADGQSRSICVVDFSTMRTKPILEIEEKWTSPDGNSYYVDAFFGVGAYRSNVIYNTNKNIYALNLKSGVKVEVTAPVPKGKQIFGLWTRGDTVYYAVSDTPDGQMQLLWCSVAELADYLWGDADQNGVVDGRDVTTIRRYVEGLPTVCHTGAADLDDSGAVDARDVEILRRHLVENH